MKPFFDLLVPFLLSGAGVTAIVSVITGAVKWRADRQPRQRVTAIRVATETLALLQAGSTAHEAVSDQIRSEAAALQASLKPKRAKRPRLVSPAVGLAASLVGAVLGVALALVPAGEGGFPGGGHGSAGTSTAFAIFLGWVIPILILLGAGIVGLVLKRISRD